MSNPKQTTGECLCGAVHVQLTLPDDTFGSCHCGMCRKWSGTSALAITGTDVSFKGEENISVYSSSDWAERGFCKTCGTHLFYRLKSGDFINFPLGLLNDIDDLKFTYQIFTDRKPKCYDFSNQTSMMTEKEVFAKFSSQ